MPLETPPKIPANDILRHVRGSVNSVVDALIVDGAPTADGFELTTPEGDAISVDLTGTFLKRSEVDELIIVPPASENRSGRLSISSEQQAVDLDDDTSAMTPAKMLIALMARGLEKMDLSGGLQGQGLSISIENDEIIIKPNPRYLVACEVVEADKSAFGSRFSKRFK